MGEGRGAYGRFGFPRRISRSYQERTTLAMCKMCMVAVRGRARRKCMGRVR